MPLLVLLTGSSGSVGSAVLLYLLRGGHSVIAIDIVPLPSSITDQIPPEVAKSYSHHLIDLTTYAPLDALFDSESSAGRTIDGVIHLGAIPAPTGHDPRVVHNLNVTSAYNVLQTAASRGVKRLVQASSVNAPGLSFTPEGRQRFGKVPLTEENAEMCAMDPYALSKEINETQALWLSRTYPDVRVASLRFHMVVPSYAAAVERSRWEDLFAWVSHEACAEACVRGLVSEGWKGAEAFYIVADEICWEEGKSPGVPGWCPAVRPETGAETAGTGQGKRELGGESRGEQLEDLPGTIELLKLAWGDRIAHIDETYWKDKPRRSPFSCEKAERLLDWRHA